MSDVQLTAEKLECAAPPIGWRRLLSVRVGPLPLPVYAALSAVTIAAALTGKLPNDIIGGLSVMLLMGFLLGELGSRLPVLKQIGGTAILCLFVPAALVGYKVMDPEMLKAVSTTFKVANFQYFYIACLVAGSILGMPHRVLVQGFLRMFVPLLGGTLAAITAGILVGLFFGYDPLHTFFFILIPIVGGGLAEGVLPLSIGYSEIMQRPQGELVAMMVPAALLGNVVAIIASGLLHRLGQRYPQLSGNGMLVRSGDDRELLAEKGADRPLEFRLMGAGLLLACGFFTLGALLAPVTGIPGPILMIICAAVLKVSKILPAEMEAGAYQINKFMSTNLTFGILVAMGSLLVSWPQLVASFTIGYFAICGVTVLAMIAAGFVIGARLRMFPVESAIVTACHSGLGGTGDVAILSASDRMGLMPFAQISTRIGGAAMIVIATLLARLVYGG
ncbi:2-hydroxycarboxylate transporter family protein [Azospirillum sp. TSO22-1]|uniref:2-hydroxycarboxylate transporter family protein n=1 Tax=Azospirillum sp. TSO22-1 TaxID=716789 RepID=UPI0018EE7223|nr:2-hydroxycarboxylate transporter family protein [Azospirillum sp. TSO22-1]